MTWATPDLSDQFADARIAVDRGRHCSGRARLRGTAVTVQCVADNWRVRELANTPGHGRVLVVDGGGDRQYALLGDLMAAAGLANGWSGVLINTCVRDGPALATMDLGVVALGACPRKTNKRSAGLVGSDIMSGGVRIAAGDVGDADAGGVLVLDAAQDVCVDVE